MQTSSSPVSLLQQILCLVDSTCEVRGTTSIEVVGQHDLAVSILSVGPSLWANTGEKTRDDQWSGRGRRT